MPYFDPETGYWFIDLPEYDGIMFVSEEEAVEFMRGQVITMNAKVNTEEILGSSRSPNSASWDRMQYNANKYSSYKTSVRTIASDCVLYYVNKAKKKHIFANTSLLSQPHGDFDMPK